MQSKINGVRLLLLTKTSFEYSSFDVDTLNEVSIQLRNLWRGLLFSKKPVVRSKLVRMCAIWLLHCIVNHGMCIVASVEH